MKKRDKKNQKKKILNTEVDILKVSNFSTFFFDKICSIRRTKLIPGDQFLNKKIK